MNMASPTKVELARELEKTKKALKATQKALEATKRELYDERELRKMSEADAETKAFIRENRASTHTAQIVFFGSIALVFAMALFK